jgi:uracil-DNA glycosylase
MKVSQTNLLPSLEVGWQKALESELNKEYMINLIRLLLGMRESGKKIFPEQGNLFSCMNLTPFHEVKVVILGQDPYHQSGQANGLSFSVNPGAVIPPSLKNIYKEILMSTGYLESNDGSLIGWAKQGVLLLNSVLSVEEGLPGSHANIGWEKFTDKIISVLDHSDKLVFMLWGRSASKKGSLINKSKHLVLESPHPSPFSVYKGFLGNGHFLKCNEFLKENKLKEITW